MFGVNFVIVIFDTRRTNFEEIRVLAVFTTIFLVVFSFLIAFKTYWEQRKLISLKVYIWKKYRKTVVDIRVLIRS